MAEQWLKAFTIDVEALFAVVGSHDSELVERALDHELAEEVDELLEEEDLELEPLLREVVDGRLEEDNLYGYRRLLELVASVVGEPVESLEALMPGRGWQELGPAWANWGLPTLGGIWGGGGSGNEECSWPWRERPKTSLWPVAVVVPRQSLPALAEELTDFESKIVAERGVPRDIDRFGDPERWPVDHLAEVLAEVVEVLRGLIDRAIEKAVDLLLWQDGQQ